MSRPVSRFFILLLLLALIPACSSRYIFGKGTRATPDKTPFQCYLAPEKLIVAAEVPEGKKAQLKYWETGKPETEKTVDFRAHWDTIYHAAPDGLELSKSYTCAVEIDGKMGDPVKMTPGSAGGESFTFLVLGDTRAPNAVPHRLVINQMVRHDAEYYIHLGDFVIEGSNPKQWKEFFEVEKPLLELMPIAAVAGNHDMSDAGIFTGLFFRGERYYSFKYGNTLTIVLDSNVAIRKGDRQYEFLEGELERSGKEGVDHVFVAVHDPPYSSGMHGGSEMVLETVVPLCEKYGVAAVFSGHDHHYERMGPINGVAYFISGGGGSPLRDIDIGPDTEKILSAFHFLKIRVEGKSVFMQAINQNGKVIDETQIR